MGFLRSQVVGSIKWVLARQGGVLVSTSRFGIYPFADVKRLAAEWKYPVTTIFDVGASEGESTLDALNRFPEARVLGFEPHPSTFANLMAKVGGNPRFQGFNVALGTDIGEVEMIEYDRFRANSLTPNNPHATRFNKHGQRHSCTGNHPGYILLGTLDRQYRFAENRRGRFRLSRSSRKQFDVAKADRQVRPG